MSWLSRESKFGGTIDISNFKKSKYPLKINTCESFVEPAYISEDFSTDYVWVWLDKENKVQEGYRYAYAVTLQYAAYFMTTFGTESSNLSINELADLWYHTLHILPSNCTFEIFRYCMEKTADNLGFSADKKDLISAAFKEIGVESRENNTSQPSETTENEFKITEQEALMLATDCVIGKKITLLFIEKNFLDGESFFSGVSDKTYFIEDKNINAYAVKFNSKFSDAFCLFVPFDGSEVWFGRIYEDGTHRCITEIDVHTLDFEKFIDLVIEVFKKL